MFNPTWLYTGLVYAGAVGLARRGGIELPKRIAAFFYALVFVFFYPVLTQDAVNTSVDFLGTLAPWESTVAGDFRPGNVRLRDVALQIVPWAHQVREGWRSLTPPLWDPFSGAGQPLLANPRSSALSPLRLLGLPLSLAHAMSFEAAMKVLLALACTYLWCRRRGCGELPSATGAVVFGFSAFVIGGLHFPRITTACLAPAALYVLELLAERITYARFAALSLIGAAMLFGGDLETAAQTAILAALYVLWLVFVERRPQRLLLALLGAAVVAILLAAPLLAPFIEALRQSKSFGVSDAARSEPLTGFATVLGAAAWLAVLASVVRAKRWRSREAFFLIAAALVLQYPLLVLLLGVLTACAIELLQQEGAGMVLLAAILAALWIPVRDWNPVVPSTWMYPETPMLHALGDLAKNERAPFRIAGYDDTFSPRVSAVYGYEDVRAGAAGDEPDWEHPLVDYLNVRYVLTPPGGELPPRFHLRYDGSDGRIFENAAVLPRFFAARNVIIEFRDDRFARLLRDHTAWADTALLETLDLESQQQHDDFFHPRPPDAPLATADVIRAARTDYRIRVRAPRWSLVVSSIPWWPGWKVERTGARVQPIRVNGSFLGFAVPSGQLDVRVWYDPWTFRLGVIIAAATLTVLAAYGVRRRNA